MIFYMHRKIFRFLVAHMKLISRSSKSDQHEMVLYNEKPQKSKSLIVSIDEKIKKQLYQSNEIKTIRNTNSRLFFLFNSNCLVLYRDAAQTVPVVKDWIHDSKMPEIGFRDLIKWYAKAKDSGDKDSGSTGVRLGRLDAANEAGFFYRTERSRLREIKKQLQNKSKSDPTAPKKK